MVLQSTYLCFMSNEDHTFEKKNVSFLLVTSTLRQKICAKQFMCLLKHINTFIFKYYSFVFKDQYIVFNDSLCFSDRTRTTSRVMLWFVEWAVLHLLLDANVHAARSAPKK